MRGLTGCSDDDDAPPNLAFGFRPQSRYWSPTATCQTQQVLCHNVTLLEYACRCRQPALKSRRLFCGKRWALLQRCLQLPSAACFSAAVKSCTPEASRSDAVSVMTCSVTLTSLFDDFNAAAALDRAFPEPRRWQDLEAFPDFQPRARSSAEPIPLPLAESQRGVFRAAAIYRAS